MVKDKIKELRNQKKLTQTELAQALNVSKGTIGNWEAGHRQPDHTALSKIADFFGVSVDYILDRENENSPSETDELSDDEKIVMYMYRSITTLDEKKAFISDLMKRIPSELSAEVVSLALTALNTSKEQR